MLPRPSDMVGSLGVVVHVAMNGQQVRVHGHSSSRPAGRLIRNEHLDLASASESGVGTGTATVPGSLHGFLCPLRRVLRIVGIWLDF